MKQARVVLSHCHTLVREMLGDRLERDGGICVAGKAATGDELLDVAVEQSPDVIVLDVDLPGAGWSHVMERVRACCDAVRFLLFATRIRDQLIDDARRLGAQGIVTEWAMPEEFVVGVLEVAAGRQWYCYHVQRRMDIAFAGDGASRFGDSRLSRLTERELTVLRCVACGMPKKEIAKRLHVGVKTVEKHSDNLMSKLDIHDRVLLARYAIREGLTDAWSPPH